MKNKILLPIILIISLFILIGCVVMFGDDKQTDKSDSDEITQGTGNVDDDKEDEEIEEVVGQILDYFPMNENTLYTYKSQNGEKYDYSIFNLYTDEDSLQRVIFTNFSLTNVEEVLKYEEGSLKYINGTQRGTLYKKLLNNDPKYNIIVLQEPLKLDTVWQMDQHSMSAITDVSAIIETDIGSFPCIEITTNYTDGTFEKTYYAKNIGLVKTISTNSNGEEVVHVLSEMVEDTSYKIEFPSYYYIADVEQLRYMPMQIEIESDMHIEKLIENALTNNMDEENMIYSVLNGATINFLEIYDEENYVHIDLDNYNLTNAGVGGEQVMIEGLVNSVCQFTNKPKLKLTINGNYYNSEHLGLIEELIDCKLFN